MKHELTSAAKGVYVIAATPFTDDGAVDFDSIDQLVDFYIGCGVHGMTILGVMGEAQKLSESESLAVAERFLSAAKGRIPVIAGISNPGNAQLAKLGHAAMKMGAAGVMLQAIPGLKTEDAVLGYFAGAMRALGAGIPACLQDYPQLTGVFISADCVLKLFKAHEQFVMFKHEEAPGLRKLSTLRKACDGVNGRYISILCGNGGMHLPQEYLRGADGAMTGFAYPDMLVKLHGLFASGKPDAAEDLFDQYLPVLRHEGQMGLGLALRKEILRRRGAIKSAAVRAPGPKLDADDLAELNRLMARLNAKTGA